MIKSLYDEFAKRWYRGGSIWFYSDPHFNDPESAYFRKNYPGDDEQVRRINRKLGEKDTIIFLGDICDVEFIKKIRGYKVLILGNHDSGATNYLRKIEDIEHFDSSKIPEEEISQLQSKLFSTSDPNEVDKISKEFYKKYSWIEHRDNHLFDEVYESVLMIGSKIILSHEPIEFPYAFNIHGHDHSGRTFNDKMHMNVCAELIDYMPVSIKKIIDSGNLKNVVDIHREAIDKQCKESLKNKGIL